MSEKENVERLRLRDSRDIYMLLGECLALGRDGIGWRRHLVVQLRKLFNADVAFFSDNVIVRNPESPEGRLRPVSIIDDWECNDKRHVLWKFVQESRFKRSPAVSMIGSGAAINVASRADLVSDDQWYESDFYRENMLPTQLDDFVNSVYLGPDGVIQMLALHRAHGKPPFPRVVVQMLRVIWNELSVWQPDQLSGVTDSVFMNLPKRMLQVLSCLLAGYTVKKTAALLEISVHTAQEHVKRLYKKSGVTSRAGLCAHYRDISATLIAIPLEKFSDHQQHIYEATREPRPAEPGVSS